MVRRNLWIVATVLVLGSVAATAMAQPGGMGMFGGGGGANVTSLNLLQIAEVRTELAVTPEQQTKITDLAGEVRQKVQDAMSGVSFPDMQSATAEERQTFMTDMRKKMDEANKGTDEKLGGILNGTQSKRLHELLLQRIGAPALVLPDVVKSLGLGDDQVTKIKAAIAAGNSARPQFNFDPNQSPEDRQAAMQEMQKKIQAQTKKTMDESVALLTDAQKTSWTALCGKPFTFPANAGRGGRGGFGGGMGPQPPQQ
jgi:hypothetical protein